MKQTKNSFLTGPILPTLVRFALPILLALVLQALYGAVDLWAVGKFAATGDISAVTTGSQVMSIVTSLITGLTMGTTVLLGMRVGSDDHDGAAAVVSGSVWIFGALGAALSIVLVLAAPWLAEVTNAPASAFAQTVAYIRICGGGSLFIVAYNVISAVFRAMGDSRSPLLFVTVACVTNIIGDVTLIRFFGMGAAGAAVATVAAQAVSVVLSLVLILKRGLPFAFSGKRLRADRNTITEILRLGAPIALQGLCSEGSFLVIVGLVNALGEVASASIGIAEKIVMFVLLVPMSCTQALSAFVAQNVGAGLTVRARQALWRGMTAAAALGFCIACVTFLKGDVLASLFVRDGDTQVIAAASQFLKATSIECFTISIAYCFTGYFNGNGKTTFVMAQGMLSTFLVRIPWAWYASTKADPRLFEIGLSAAFAAVFTLSGCIIYYVWHRKKESCTVG